MVNNIEDFIFDIGQYLDNQYVDKNSISYKYWKKIYDKWVNRLYEG